MADAFPSAADRRFSVLVEGADPSASVIVDRAIFWRGAGETRTAGAEARRRACGNPRLDTARARRGRDTRVRARPFVFP